MITKKLSHGKNRVYAHLFILIFFISMYSGCAKKDESRVIFETVMTPFSDAIRDEAFDQCAAFVTENVTIQTPESTSTGKKSIAGFLKQSPLRDYKKSLQLENVQIDKDTAMISYKILGEQATAQGPRYIQADITYTLIRQDNSWRINSITRGPVTELE